MPESNLTPPDSLLTERLVLRKARPDDAPLIFAAYAQDPEVTRYLTFRPHGALSDTRTVVDRFLENWSAGKSYCWLIFSRENDELVGAISAREDQGINLGYLIARPYWRRGFMSEAVSAVTDWAFSHADVFRVWAVCDLENDASAQLLEKNGFHQEGILRNWSLHPNVSDIPRDCYCYAKTRSPGLPIFSGTGKNLATRPQTP
jgi:RimJ/RimL family protein N-acetyltransferase